jgi:hypothetical protein
MSWSNARRHGLGCQLLHRIGFFCGKAACRHAGSKAQCGSSQDQGKYVLLDGGRKDLGEFKIWMSISAPSRYGQRLGEYGSSGDAVLHQHWGSIFESRPPSPDGADPSLVGLLDVGRLRCAAWTSGHRQAISNTLSSFTTKTSPLPAAPGRLWAG